MRKIYPTLRDVARLANVSVSTVSRVLSKHPDVSEKTRNKVLKVVEEIGYQPSMIAKGLVSGKSKSIGLLVSDVVNPFYPQLIRSVEEVASKAGYVVFLGNTYDDPARSRKYMERFIRQGVDGIIHASVYGITDLLQDLRNQKFPLVLINRRDRNLKGITTIVFDSYKSAQIATKHLLTLGHRLIALIIGPLFISTEQDRLLGYREEITRNGIAVREDWIIVSETSRAAGYKIGRELLRQPQRPTAIIANDIVAYGVIDAACEMSMNIPGDLSVVGFGVVEHSNLGSKEISSISSRISEMGKLGCQKLIDMIENRSYTPTEITLDVEFVDRGSTAPPSLL